MSKPIKTPKSPYFQYDIQIGGARFHGSTKCKTYRDAERFIEKLRRRVALGEEGLEEVTVDEACGLWWDAVGQYLSAHKTEEGRLAALVSGLGANELLSRLTLREWDAYVTLRLAPIQIPAVTRMVKGKLVVVREAREFRRSRSTVNREIQLARRVWAYVGEEDRGYRVKTPNWSKLIGKEPQERVRELSPEEEARLFQHLPAAIADMVEFAMLSGQRRSEVISLRWKDVDLAGRRCTVTVKGGNRHTFPITAHMVGLLKKQPRVAGVEEVFTYECKREVGGHETNVRRLAGKRYPFSKQGWKGQWERALKAAGINDFRFHDLRHTCATRLVRETGNLKIAQKLLGHSDIKTTARYAHATADDVAQAMERTQSQKNPVAYLKVVE